VKEDREALYAKVEIARKRLIGMEDDEIFHDWLEKFFWVRSQRDLSFQQLKRLVDLLGRMGARNAGQKREKAFDGKKAGGERAA
jgi:hypothetical protein